MHSGLYAILFSTRRISFHPNHQGPNQAQSIWGHPWRAHPARKMFFFGGYQRTAFRNVVLGSSKVVGQSDINNFLSAPSTTCSSCGGPFGTPGTIDPSIATMLGIDPTTGTYLGSSAKYSLDGAPPPIQSTAAFVKPDIENYDSGMGRSDYSLRPSDRLTARYEYDRFTKAPVFNPLSLVSYTDATFSIVAQNALLHETHVFSPKLVNDARFSYSREVSHRGPGSDAVSAAAFGGLCPFSPSRAPFRASAWPAVSPSGTTQPACSPATILPGATT